MLSLIRAREWVAAVTFGLILLVIVPLAAVGFSLDGIVMFLLCIAVLSGSFFGEWRDTWNTEREFSLARVFFRTFEWLSLAVAGYIILSVISSNAFAST